MAVTSLDDSLKTKYCSAISAFQQGDAAPLKTLFTSEFDLDGDGKVSKQEFIDVLSTANPKISKQMLSDAADDADKNKDGIISPDEFLEAMQGFVKYVTPLKDERLSACKESLDKFLAGDDQAPVFNAFGFMNPDGQGFINIKQAKAMILQLKSDWTPEQIDTFMDEADENKDGVLSTQEIMKAMKKLRA